MLQPGLQQEEGIQVKEVGEYNKNNSVEIDGEGDSQKGSEYSEYSEDSGDSGDEEEKEKEGD